MKNILIILKHNLKSIKKSWFLLVLVFPIVVNVFLFRVNKNTEESSDSRLRVGVYTEDSSEVFKRLLPEEKFKEISTVDSKEQLRSMVENSDIPVGVIINSSDIYNDLKNNKKGTIEILVKDKDVREEQLKGIINNSVLQLTSFGNSKEEALEGFDQYEKSSYNFDYKSSKLKENIGYISIFGLFCMGFMFIAGNGVSPLLKEKEISIDKRILVSKISKFEYTSGHILGCFVLLLFQSITLSSTFYIFNSDFNVNFGWMLLLSLALCFVGIAIALFVLSLSNNSTMYYTLLTVIITPISLFGGGFVPLEFMPEFIQKISLISPLTWVTLAYKNILLEGSANTICMNLLAGVSISTVFIILFLIIESRKKIKIS